MALRDGTVGYDQLHHFIAAGTWDAAPLEAELVRQAERLLGGEDAVLIVDDTALPKKGSHSVGVAPQYAAALGKTANCQTLVSLTLAAREVPVVVGLRLFLPENWTRAPERLIRAGVTMIFPLADRFRPRKRHIPDGPSLPAQSMLENATWRTLSWRCGRKGRPSARFAALRARVADGEPQRIAALGAQHMPGEQVWLIGEHRRFGERKSCRNTNAIGRQINALALQARSAKSQGLERNRPPESENGSRSARAVSRSARKGAGNLRLSAPVNGREKGWIRGNWSG